jgi:hypothetical protein
MDDRFSLRVESGPDSGRTVAIPLEGITIGRRPESGLVLADASVSGKHAELRVGADGVVVRDLGSTNGTYVGAARVLEHTLQAGDRLRFGSVQATFFDAKAAPPKHVAPAVHATPPKQVTQASVPVAGSADDEITLEEPELPVARPAQTPAAPKAAAAAKSPSPAALARTAFEPAARADASQAGESFVAVGDEVLSRAKRDKRPLALFAFAGVAAFGSVAGVVWFRYFRGGSQRHEARAPEAPAGNLLAGAYSFEGDAAAQGWTAAETATQTLFPEICAAFSGRSALAASLGAGEWALSRSDAVRVAARRGVALRAAVRRSGGVEARVGIALLGADDAHPTLHGWSAPLAIGDDWTNVELDVPVLPGWDRVEVLLAARGAESGGRAAFDDVSLMQSEQQVPPAAESGDYKLWWLGDAHGSAVLMRIEQWIAAGIALSDSASAPDGYPRRTAVATARVADGLAVAFGALDGAQELSWLVNPNTAKQGLATIGPAGYRARQREFEATPTTSVLLGSGYQMVRMSWPTPLALAGAPVDGGYRFSAACTAPFEITLQLSFKDERALANRAAEAAREAEKSGRLGECMRGWGELLSKWPFEEALVKEAEAARARLAQSGQEQVRAIEAELERAKFFGLEDLYRQCEQKARELVDRYASSELGLLAQQLAERAASEADAAGTGSRDDELARLRAIRGALPSSPRLGALIDEELTRMAAPTSRSAAQPANPGDGGDS